MLQWWWVREHLSQGIPFTLLSTTITISTDVSMEGCGGHCWMLGVDHGTLQHLLVKDRTRTPHQCAGAPGGSTDPTHLEKELFSQTVLIESDNTATMLYINKQGGVVSKTLNNEACALYEWAIPRSLRLRAIHWPGVSNELADYLSCNFPDPTEWHLSPLIAQSLLWRWGRPQVDLFASHRNHQLPCWFSRTGHPVTVMENGCLSMPFPRSLS